MTQLELPMFNFSVDEAFKHPALGLPKPPEGRLRRWLGEDPEGWVRRSVYFFYVAVTGIVLPIARRHVVQMMLEHVKVPQNKRVKLLEDAKQSSQNRRLSIFENTAKGTMVISGVAGGIAVLAFVLPSAKGWQFAGLLAGVLQLFFTVVLIIWMSSPKWKVFRRKRLRVPVDLRRLQDYSHDAEFDRAFPSLSGFCAYLRAAQTREERDMKLLVDRRMLLLASIFYVMGMATVLAFFVR